MRQLRERHKRNNNQKYILCVIEYQSRERNNNAVEVIEFALNQIYASWLEARQQQNTTQKQKYILYDTTSKTLYTGK